MPNKDGTGPDGKGPKTGRQMGDCEGAEPVAGRGRGRGVVRGRGAGQGAGRGLGRGQGRRARN